MEKTKSKSIVKNFTSLSFANIISNIALMVQGMILVRALTKTEYGTYAQTNIVINITNTIIGLGLAASINYFIPISNDVEQRKKYVNNIFSLVVLTGLIGMLCIIVFKNDIINYFNNNSLSPLISIIAFRPLFSGILQALINLFVANKHAEVVAKRNVALSIFSLFTLGIVSIITHNLKLLIICLLILDILQSIALYLYSRLIFGKISFFKYNIPIIRGIFNYSIPLALSSMVGTLIIQMDRLIIGKLFSTEAFAVYSVVSTPLPFTIFATAIVTVIRPYITKYYTIDVNSVKKLWSSSIEFSAIITWTIGFAMILVSPEIITFLYTGKYLSGLIVFNIFILNSMISITYFGMILSASGKSRWILLYAIITLILNIIMNFIFYWMLGYNGPALASVFSQFIINTLQLVHSSKLLRCKIKEFINFKALLSYLVSMILVLCILLFFKLIFDKHFNTYKPLEMLIFGGAYCLILGGIFIKRLRLLSISLKG